jgi:hypothetical protein
MAKLPTSINLPWKPDHASIQGKNGYVINLQQVEYLKDLIKAIVKMYGDIANAMNLNRSDMDALLIDEDDFISNLDTKAPTQQSTKAYVDGKVSDSAFAAGWDGVTGIAPSKNAVYDAVIDEDNMASNSDARWPTQQSVKAYVDGKGYVDRGDPAAYDFTLAGLTTDGTYRELDCGAIVPAGAKAIHFLIVIQDNAAGMQFVLRDNANSNPYNTSSIFTQVAGVYMNADFIVACDTDRKLKYFASNTTWTVINILVRGWWL